MALISLLMWNSWLLTHPSPPTLSPVGLYSYFRALIYHLHWLSALHSSAIGRRPGAGVLFWISLLHVIQNNAACKSLHAGIGFSPSQQCTNNYTVNSCENEWIAASTLYMFHICATLVVILVWWLFRGYSSIVIYTSLLAVVTEQHIIVIHTRDLHC